MPHIKRQNMGKFWPVSRKGTKYVAVASHNQKNSISLVIVMRNILNLVKTKKELKKAINEKLIKINNKEIRDVNYPLGLFDVLSVGGKNYRAGLSANKKMIFEEVKDVKNKTVKIIGKKILGKDKIQLNLMDGRNVLSKEKAKVGDSAVISFDGKLEKIIKMEKGKIGFVFEGKHAGHKGKIENIVERGGKNLAQIVDEDKKKINVWIKNVIVMEK
jgi:ribosomal protein S4E